MAANKFHYRASLRETTLPEMLYSIDRFRVPGVIEARFGELVKRVFIRDGYVVHASSSDRRDSLGDFLHRSGQLTEQDFAIISRARSHTEQRFGVLLIEQNLLSPREVFEAIQKHIEEIVWSLFYWQQGEVSFGIGETKNEDMVQIQLPMRRVIVEGIKRAPDAKPLVGRLGKKETVFEPCFRWEDLIEIGLDAEEYRLLRMVDSRKSLYQLCSQGPLTPAENAKLIYAFQVLHLVRQSEARRERAAGPLKIKLPASGGPAG